jgi:inorganic pyrophosphatase
VGRQAVTVLCRTFRSAFASVPHVVSSSKGEETKMANYLELPVGDKAPEVFRCVIEIPMDGTQKFEYDKQLHVFKLDRNLHSPVHYPGDYGFIPSTLSDDGDPLDVLVLVPGPSFPGCVQEVRPIGLLEMLDQGVLDEKVLAVGKNNPRYTNVWNYTDIYPHMLKEITHFFSIYKDLEGKRVEIRQWHDAAYARDRVTRSIKLFEEAKAKIQAKKDKKEVAV